MTIIIWDFDGVILNSGNNYTYSFLYQNSLIINNSNVSKINLITNKKIINIILTGRNLNDKKLIKNIIKNNNINIIFKKIIVSKFKEKDYKNEKFIYKYLEYKEKNFKKIIKKYKNDKIIIIDDNIEVINIAKKLNIIYVYIEKFLEVLNIEV